MSVIPFYGAHRRDLFGVERRSMDRPGRVVAELDRRLPTDGEVVDLGAGDGWTAARLATDRRTIVAVEPAAGMRAQAAAHPCVLSVGAEAGALPLADASVDAAYATWSYLFPSHRDPSRGLAELHRVVRPGGPIVVVTNAGDDEFTALGTASGGEDLGWFADRGFDVEVVDTTFDLTGEDPALVAELLARYVGGADHLADPRPRAYGYRVAIAEVASSGASPIAVRGMRRHEAARVGALTQAAYDRYGTMDGEYREFLGDPLARIDGCTAVLVAEDTATGEVLGTVSYVTPGDPQWEDRAVRAGDAGFRILAVDPAAEGRGVGTRLVDACFDRAREAGCRRMLITSMEWMGRAHELYTRRYGFVRREDLDVRFPTGRGVIFACDLTPDASDHFPPPGPVPAEPPWYEDVWSG